MAKVECGDCDRSFEPDTAPGAAAPVAKAGAVIDRLVRMFAMFAGAPVAICPERRSAKRKGCCLSCHWPRFGHCPDCGAMTLF